MAAYPFTVGFGVGTSTPTTYTGPVWSHAELQDMVTDAEQECIRARKQLASAQQALQWYELAASNSWNPRVPVKLVAGDRVLVRGCFGPDEVCSKWVAIPEGTVANRLAVGDLSDDPNARVDKYDDEFADQGMTKVEWYSFNGRGIPEYIKCWVDSTQILH